MVTRLRLGLRQTPFWEGVTDQQTGSKIESGRWIGTQNRLNSLIKKITEKWDCEPSNITICEFIHIARNRLRITIKAATILFRRPEQWLIAVEHGKKHDDRQLLVYKKLKQQDDNN